MSAAQILREAHSLGVRLRLEGNVVKLRGPAKAIASIKPVIAGHKAEIMAYLRAVGDDAASLPADCAGALHDPGGGWYLPWGPYLTAADVRRMRADLAGTIDALAALEGWPRGYHDAIMSRALNAPLSALAPDLAYFRERLDDAREDAAMRAAMAARTWRYDPTVRQGKRH